MPGNDEAWEVVELCSSQLRMGFAGPVGFDWNAVGRVAGDLCIDTPPAFWRKIRAVENAMLAVSSKAQNRK